MTGLYMGQALGGFGAVIAANSSWQLTFHSIGIIGVVYALVLVAFLREPREPATLEEMKEKGSVFSGMKGLLGLLSFWVIFLYFSIPSIPGWAIKNWLPTLFSDHMHIEMSKAGPLATISTAVSSFIGVVIGGLLSDSWVQRNVKGRIYTSAIGLSLTIPALLFLGIGNSVFALLAAAFCFGIGFGMFDANNMPILCQFVPREKRASAYGLMNLGGVFSGALITDFLGKSTDAGHLGRDFSLMSLVIVAAVVMLLALLKPKTSDL